MGCAPAMCGVLGDYALGRATLRCCEFMTCCYGADMEERDGSIFLQSRDNCATWMGMESGFTGNLLAAGECGVT